MQSKEAREWCKEIILSVSSDLHEIDMVTECIRLLIRLSLRRAGLLHVQLSSFPVPVASACCVKKNGPGKKAVVQCFQPEAFSKSGAFSEIKWSLKPIKNITPSSTLQLELCSGDMERSQCLRPWLLNKTALLRIIVCQNGLLETLQNQPHSPATDLISN